MKKEDLERMAEAKEKVHIAFQYDSFIGFLSPHIQDVWFYETECIFTELSFRVDPDKIWKVSYDLASCVKILHHMVAFVDGKPVGLPFH